MSSTAKKAVICSPVARGATARRRFKTSRMLQAGYRQSGTCSSTETMLSTLVSGQPLHRPALPTFREAYSLVNTHARYHESEYSHLSALLFGNWRSCR